jgi:hypothetical protein
MKKEKIVKEQAGKKDWNMFSFAFLQRHPEPIGKLAVDSAEA